MQHPTTYTAGQINRLLQRVRYTGENPYELLQGVWKWNNWILN